MLKEIQTKYLQQDVQGLTRRWFQDLEQMADLSVWHRNSVLTAFQVCLDQDLVEWRENLEFTTGWVEDREQWYQSPVFSPDHHLNQTRFEKIKKYLEQTKCSDPWLFSSVKKEFQIL